MNKKMKKINIHISLDHYKYLKKHYSWTKNYDKNKHKSFSDYILYLLVLGVNDYYQKIIKKGERKLWNTILIN